MALKRLTTQEMLDVSAPWTARDAGGGSARRLLQGIPEVAVLLPRLEQAHQALLHTRREPADAGLAELDETAMAVDARHDDLVRGIHAVLTGFAALAGDPREAERLVGLRDRLLPDGLSATQLTYREEAAHGQSAAAALDEDARAVLRSLPTPGGPLEGAVDRWLAHAQRLGELEDERAVRLSAGRGGGEAEAEEVQARNRWIRVVTALVTNLEVGTTDPARADEILGPLREADRGTERASGRFPSVSGVEEPAA